MTPLQYAAGSAAGGLVGLVLGVVGGGGSILAVPLMVHLVGVADAHVAIGTSALAVAANATTGLAFHARQGTVRWRPGALYAAAGVAGAFAGSSVGKLVDGKRLLLLFAAIMVVAALAMLRRREPAAGDVMATGGLAVLGYGLGTGALAGFFGIGGGFLIVPGLVGSTRMPMLNAVGTSLIAVAAFGATTAVNYAASGFVDCDLAVVFIAGGILGGVTGARACRSLAKGPALKRLFATLVLAVAGWMAWSAA